MPTAEAGGRWRAAAEAEGRRVGLQTSGGGHPVNIQHLSSVLAVLLSVSDTKYPFSLSVEKLEIIDQCWIF